MTRSCNHHSGVFTRWAPWILITGTLSLAYSCGGYRDVLEDGAKTETALSQQDASATPVPFVAMLTESAAAASNACPLDRVAIWHDNPTDTQAPQVYVRTPGGIQRQWALRVLPAGVELFHWGAVSAAASESAHEHAFAQAMQAWRDSSAHGHYRGLRVSLHPFDAIDSGSHLMVFQLQWPLRAVEIPDDGEYDPLDALAEEAGFRVSADDSACSWVQRFELAGIGAIGKVPSTHRLSRAPWPEWLTVFSAEALARSHTAQPAELMSRLRKSAWPSDKLALPSPVLKTMVLVRLAPNAGFSLGQLPLTFFDDALWVHQVLTHGTVQGTLPKLRLRDTTVDAKTFVCQVLPSLPGWQSSALYMRLMQALCCDDRTAARARGEET